MAHLKYDSYIYYRGPGVTKNKEEKKKHKEDDLKN